MAITASLCETCMTPYSSEPEAEQCEAIHQAHAYVNVVGFSYVPRDHPSYPYPSELRAGFDNPDDSERGHIVTYKFSEIRLIGMADSDIGIEYWRAYTPPTPIR